MSLRSFIRREHEAKYASPAIYYTFAFSLPTGTDIYKLANTLLRRDLASAAGSAVRGVRYAHRYSVVQKNRALAETLSTLRDVEEGKQGIVPWMVAHPRAAAVLLRRRMITFSRSASKKPDPELIEAYDNLAKIPSELDARMVDIGLVMGSQLTTDETLFSPGYLADEPFIRLDLDSVFVETDVFADPEVEITLLLHRSGTALLTFAAIPGLERSTDDLLASSGRNVTFTKTMLTEPLGKLVGAANREFATEDKWNEGEEGIRWREITWSTPLPLQALFVAYCNLLGSIIRRRGDHGDWMCYTTLFVDKLSCCGKKDRWLARHAAELASLIGQYEEYSNTKASVVDQMLASERGMRKTEGRYFEAGNAIVVRWMFEPDTEPTSSDDHFSTLAVVQSALLQYWQLVALDARFAASTWKLSDLLSIQRQLVGGLDEYRGGRIISIDARVDERDITQKLGLDTLHARVLERLGAIHQLMEIRSAQVSGRRNLLIATIGVFATVLLGVPAVKDILGIVGQLDTTRFPARLIWPLARFAENGPAGIWNLYLILLGAVSALSLAGLLMKVRDVRKVRYGQFGVGSNVTYERAQPTYRKGRLIEEPTKGEDDDGTE